MNGGQQMIIFDASPERLAAGGGTCPTCGASKGTACRCYDEILPNDLVPKLITTSEWKSLSAVSRLKINSYFSREPLLELGDPPKELK